MTGLLVLVLLFGGSILIFLLGSYQQKRAAELADLPEITVDTFYEASPDIEMVITGVLEGNREFATSEGYVVYRRQEWDVSYDSEDGYEGKWKTREKHFPPLNLTISGGNIQILSTDEARIWGREHATIVERSDSTRKADGIPEGSIRHIGFKEGDTITVVGQKDASRGGSLHPSQFYGGDRAQLIKATQGEARASRIIGIVLVALGIIIMVVRVFKLLRGR
jgi:hypothetical protein